MNKCENNLFITLLLLGNIGSPNKCWSGFTRLFSAICRVTWIVLNTIVREENRAFEDELGVYYLRERILLNLGLNSAKLSRYDLVFGWNIGVIKKVGIAHKLLRDEVRLPRIQVYLVVSRVYLNLNQLQRLHLRIMLVFYIDFGRRHETHDPAH